YFSTKEELLLEVILEAAVQKRDEAIAALHATEDLAFALRNFGTIYLKWITSPDSLALLRISIAQGRHANIGHLYWERGPGPGWNVLTSFLKTAIQHGKLRSEDPETMTMQLKALYEAGLVEP